MPRMYRLFVTSLAAAVLYGTPDQKTSATTAAQAAAPVKYGTLPKTPQTLTSGVWRVDQGFTSTIQLRNLRTADSITVTPTLYMADGTSYNVWGTPEAALGKLIRPNKKDDWREVIGVVADEHADGVDKPAPIQTFRWSKPERWKRSITARLHVHPSPCCYSRSPAAWPCC